MVILDILYNFVGEIIYFNPVNDIQTIQNKISDTSGEIVMYQPDETIRLEVRLGEDTVWLSQQQMSMLFGKARSTINEHIQNIYQEGELQESNSMRKFGNSEFSMKPTNYYNLDVIISVGYRVKSRCDKGLSPVTFCPLLHSRDRSKAQTI